MQRRPKITCRLEYAPISLAGDFPIVGGAIFRQADKPITWLHIHDCLELGYCHHGAGIFVVENKVFPFRAGDVSVINHREMHLAQSVKGTFSDWSFICLDPARLIGPGVDESGMLNTAPLCGPLFKNIISGAEHADIARIMRELVKEMTEKKTGYRSCARGLVLALMARLHRLPCGRKTEVAKRGQRNVDRMAPALHYMATHYMEPVRMTVLAKACFMSLTNFRRLFKRTIKKTPFEYLTHLRLQMAVVLLTDTDKTILEISLETGYATLSSFNRQFKSATGKSPSVWRKSSAEAK